MGKELECEFWRKAVWWSALSRFSHTCCFVLEAETYNRPRQQINFLIKDLEELLKFEECVFV